MERKLNCEEVRAALPLHVGGDLTPPESASVDQHLAGCGACRAEMERAGDARGAFATLDAGAGAPPEIWSGVRARLLEEGLLRSAPEASPGAEAARPEPRLVRRWIPAAASAAAALLVAGGLWLASGPRDARPAPGGGERSVAEELPAARPVERRPELVPAPDAAGARPVALQRVAPGDWPMAAPTELDARPDPGSGDGVMAAGPPTRYH